MTNFAWTTPLSEGRIFHRGPLTQVLVGAGAYDGSMNEWARRAELSLVKSAPQ